MTKIAFIIVLWEFGWEYKWWILCAIVLFIAIAWISRAGKILEIEERAKKQGGFCRLSAKEAITIGNDGGGITGIEDAVLGTVLIENVDGHGSGFVIKTVNKGWMIITNHHVIGDNEYVAVKFQDHHEEVGKVVRSDEDRDVALISFPNKKRINGMPLCLEPLSLGEEVYVIGSPVHEEYKNSISKGVVGGKRSIEGKNYIQSDATINPGNSGGPLLAKKSGYYEVVGISVSSVMLEKSPAGINLFIPVKDIMETLKIKIK